MSPIVALCHFCEVHGPRVVMVTQPIRDLTPTIQTQSNQHLFGAEVLQQSKPSSFSYHPDYGCERCWSLGDQENLIISNDSESRQTFVSSQTILDKDREIMLRNAAIRAISCEYPREGPLLFSDPSVSSILANNFYIEDAKARGFKRYYSIVVMARERHYLISNLNIIESLVSAVILNVKTLARQTYDKEALDLKLEPTKFSFLIDNGSVSTLRNLRQLVQDDNIYEKLHNNFVVLLQTLEKVLKEKVVSGQVMRSSVTYPKSSVVTLNNIKSQWESHNFRILLHHILSGKCLHIKTGDRILSRIIGECLCILLPNNITVNQSHFANLILTTHDEDENLPQNLTRLDVIGDTSQQDSLEFTLHPHFCRCFDHSSLCKYCRALNDSVLLTKLCKIFKNCINTSEVVQEVSIRTFGESILAQSRVFNKLAHKQKDNFLHKNKYTAIDAEIFIFFKYFS